ncbi:MFS transporter [Spirochaeta lutea]|nr:MFS transporter [Spirochaeta lutea]
MKGYYKITILIGLGFFTMGLMDPLYDAYVPAFLDDYLDSKFLIGLIMTLDNVFALFLIPLVASLSDRTNTPIGRRMPYILVTVPLSGIFFSLLPYGATPYGTITVLILIIFLLNLAKQAARGPVVALMPDLVPANLRSEANGVINTMGGIAAIVGTVVLAPMMDISIDLPLIGNTLRKLPFLISGVLVILATILLFIFVKEKKHAQKNSSESPEEPVKTADSLRKVFGINGDPSAALILLSLFFWFLAYQGILPFVTIYSKDILGVSEGLAGLSPGSVAIAYALFAIPSGILAHRIGRRRVITISLRGIIVVLGLVFIHDPLTSFFGLSSQVSWITFLVLFFCFGIFWGSIVTNSFPMLWQMASFTTMGIYTGLYYFFSQGAAILSPLLSGGLIDVSTRVFGPEVGLRSIFLYGIICMAVAMLLMARVKAGEATDLPAEPQTPQAD